MKVLLREHVDDLGSRGDIVSVAAGYARNYLLPRGLATEATPGNVKMLEQQRRVWALREAKEISEAQALAEQLGRIELSATKKAGESGTLYGSVTTSEIAEMLAAKGIETDRRKIVLDEPIKSLGSFTFKLKLHREVNARITLHVVGEETDE